MAIISHRVIQDAVNIVLVIAGVTWVSIEDLPDSIDTCRVIKSRPEGLLDMLYGIDAQSIN